MSPRKLLRPVEVAARTGVAEATLRYWRYAGTGPKWFKLGARRVVYDADDVEQWIEDCKRASTAATA